MAGVDGTLKERTCTRYPWVRMGGAPHLPPGKKARHGKAVIQNLREAEGDGEAPGFHFLEWEQMAEPKGPKKNRRWDCRESPSPVIQSQQSTTNCLDFLPNRNTQSLPSGYLFVLQLSKSREVLADIFSSETKNAHLSYRQISLLYLLHLLFLSDYAFLPPLSLLPLPLFLLPTSLLLPLLVSHCYKSKLISGEKEKTSRTSEAQTALLERS